MTAYTVWGTLFHLFRQINISSRALLKPGATIGSGRNHWALPKGLHESPNYTLPILKIEYMQRSCRTSSGAPASTASHSASNLALNATPNQMENLTPLSILNCKPSTPDPVLAWCIVRRNFSPHRFPDLDPLLVRCMIQPFANIAFYHISQRCGGLLQLWPVSGVVVCPWRADVAAGALDMWG